MAKLDKSWVWVLYYNINLGLTYKLRVRGKGEYIIALLY
jgi:hypothetical protein